MTCSVSGLAIGPGDSVKYFLLTENPYEDENIVCSLHDLWFPRTWPLRAEYNDYGSIENYDEKSPASYALVEGLNKDLVELGTGDNSVHDVPTRKGMSFDDILEAIWEGRLKVESEVKEHLTWRKTYAEKFPEPEGLPTLSNVEQTLKEAGFLVENTNNGYLVDEQKYGWVRVRRGGYGEKLEDLEKILPTLQAKYAAMITVGSGNYANSAEIQVMPKAMERKTHLSLRRDEEPKSLQVFQAMILTEVWDALLELSNYSKVRKDVQAVWDEAVKDQTEDQQIIVGDGPEFEELRKVQKELKNFRKLTKHFGAKNLAESVILKSVIPFTMGLAEHFQLVVEKHLVNKFTEKQIKEFLNDVAGLCCFHELLYPVRHWWRPSFSCGPQYGDYADHEKWHKILTKVSAKLKKNS